MCSRTSDRLRVGREHKQFDEAEAERGEVVLPDDGRDEEDLPVAGEQQSSEEEAQLQVPALQTSHRHPEEEEHAAAERRQLYGSHRQTSH